MRPAPLARCARCGLQFITASMSTSPHVPLGLYGHVPFCSTTCDFCAFYQIAPKRGDIKNYLAGIRREVTRSQAAPRVVMASMMPLRAAPEPGP